MAKRTLSIYWRVFAVNVGLLGAVAVLLLVTPVTISAPIKLEQALIVGVGLVVTLAANAWLLRRAVAPLERSGAADGDRRPASPRPAAGGTPRR